MMRTRGVWNDSCPTWAPSPHRSATNYLMRYNPAKAGNAPRLLRERVGREQELFANIERKMANHGINAAVDATSRPRRDQVEHGERLDTAARPGDASTTYGDRRALSTMENPA